MFGLRCELIFMRKHCFLPNLKWFKTYFQALFFSCVSQPNGTIYVHLASHSAFQVVSNIWWARWHLTIAACQPLISWKSRSEPPRLIMINVIIMQHIQRRGAVFFFTNLSAYLNCNGLLKVKFAFLLWISNFLMAALEKWRDALHILSLAEQAPTAEESIKRENTSKASLLFPDFKQRRTHWQGHTNRW